MRNIQYNLIVSAVLVLSYFIPLIGNAQATCKGAQFEEIGQGTIFLGSKYNFEGYIVNKADFDGDSLPDIITTASNTNNTKNNIVILRNISAGSAPSKMRFDTATSVFRTSYYYTDYIINDFNKDGKPDIAVAAPDSIWILINTSVKNTIRFHTCTPIGLPTKAAYPSLKTGDFNLDGLPDLMYEDSIGSVYVIITKKDSVLGYKGVRQNTGITMSPGIRGHYTYHSYDVKDMNSDSLPDVVYASPRSDTVFIYQNVSTKDSVKYVLAQIFKGPDLMETSQFWTGRHVQIQDADNDGKPDIGILYGPDTANYYVRQKLMFLKNTSIGKAISVTFADTMGLNHFTDSSYGYKINDTGIAMSGDFIIFTGFAFVNDGGTNNKPDIVLCVEGASQTYSIISYLVNKADSGRIKYTDPCWFKQSASDWVFTGDLNNDGADEIISYCDVCIPGARSSGITVFANVSTANITEEIPASSSPSYNIIPNPATDNVRIMSNQYFKSVDVIDAVGNVVKRINTTETRSYELSLNGLSAGLYYFRIQGSNDVAVKKVIKVN